LDATIAQTRDNKLLIHFFPFGDLLKVLNAHAYQFLNDYAKLLEISDPPRLRLFVELTFHNYQAC